MKTQFQKDIEILPRLKKGFFVTLASTILFSVLTVATAVCHFVGKNVDYPMTEDEKKELMEIAENDSGYMKTCKNFKMGYMVQYKEGKLSKEEYQEKVDYLETPDFINRVIDSAKTNEIRQKIADRKNALEGCDKYAALSGVLTVGSAVATGVICNKRKKLKNRWFDKEDSRGL